MPMAKKLPAWLSRRGYGDRLKQRIATTLSRDQDAQALAMEFPSPEGKILGENVLVFPLRGVLRHLGAALLLGFCSEIIGKLEGAYGSAIMQIAGAA